MARPTSCSSTAVHRTRTRGTPSASHSTVRSSRSTSPGTVTPATATTTSNLGDPNSADNTQSATTTSAALADLTLTLTEQERIYQPSSALPEYIYNLTLANAGPSLATDTAVALTLPAAVTFVSATSACTRAGLVVTCRTSALSPGENIAYVVRVAVNYGTPNGTVLAASAIAGSDATDPQPGDNTATASTTTTTDVADAVADLQLSQSAPVQALAGDTTLFALTVYNAGAAAPTYTLTDTLPAGAIFDPSLSDPACFEGATPAAVVCQGAALQVGESRT